VVDCLVNLVQDDDLGPGLERRSRPGGSTCLAVEHVCFDDDSWAMDSKAAVELAISELGERELVDLTRVNPHRPTGSSQERVEAR
jgi:hypothetical protein